MYTEILKPGHPLWDTFAGLLEGPGFCNFKEDGSWTCYGSGMTPHHHTPYAFPFSLHILHHLNATVADFKIDVKSTIEYFMEHGGSCDCTVLLNVDPD